MNNIAELRTPDSFLETLRVAATKKMTADEINEQRVSFIIGSISSIAGESGATRARIQEILANQEGRK